MPAAGASEDAADVFAKHVAAIGYADLPPWVVAATKASVLDTLACLLAGSGTPETKALVDLAAERGGRPTSTLIGRGMKLPAEAAVLVNAAAIHQYDFDDTHDVAICHPTSASLIPALALAEQKGGLSGAELIAAVALGNDMVARAALAIEGRLVDYVWFRAPVVGMFGAAAASAKVLGANADQLSHAFGLTLPMIGGTLSSLQHNGSSVRAIRDGLAYRSAVLAAELAMRGVRGDRQVMEGPFGYYRAFFRGEYDRQRLVGDLPTRWEGARVSLKPWPSIRHLHASLSCVADILEQERLTFDDVDHVVVHVGQINADRSRPVAKGAIPALRMDLLANLPFAIGTLLRHGRIPLAVYRDTALADDVIERGIPKVRVVRDASRDGKWTLEPAHVELTTKGGATHVRDRRIARGHPDDPLSADALAAKLRDCAAAAARPMPAADVDRLIAMVDALETLPDVRALAELLA